MKKQILYFASVALAAGLAACSSDELEESSNYKLGKNDLAANIEEAASTRVGIKDFGLIWNTGDQIGVYGDDNSGNYLYSLTNGSGTAAGVFTYAGDKSFTPALAYYPYRSGAATTISDGKFYQNLESEIAYAEQDVKIPMVGKITGKSIAFKNTTALLKITVVNMPANITRVGLINEDGGAIAGTALVNPDDDTPTSKLITSNKNKDNIVITNGTGDSEAAFTTGGTYDFYFIVPAGDYGAGLTFSLGSKNGGLDANGLSDDTDGKKAAAIYTKSLTAKVNTMYYKTLRYVDGAIQNDDFAEWNDKLANGENSLGADLTKKSGTFFIPAAEDTEAESITLNLKLDDGNSSTGYPVTIAATDPNKATPKVIVNLLSGTNGKAELTINLPESYVVLQPDGTTPEVEESAAKASGVKAKKVSTREGSVNKVTLAAVNSKTAKDVLYITRNLTITKLEVSGGYVYQEKGATISAAANASNYTATTYLFDASRTTTDETEANSTTHIKKCSKATYKMMFPQNGDVIPLTSETTLNEAITIGSGKEVTIQLNKQDLYAPSTTSEAIIVEGTLNITGEGSINADKTSGSAANAAILVQKGGVVNLETATIKNAHESGTAVKVNGANGNKKSTFNLKSGTLNSATAISADNGGAISINSAESDITGAVTTANASTATITAKSITGALTLAGNATVAVPTLQAVNVTDGTVSINATTSVGAVSVNGANADVDITTPQAGTVTITSGKAIVNATKVGNVSVPGGELELTTGENASTLSATAGGKLTLKDGDLTGGVTVTGATDKQSQFNMDGGKITTTTTVAVAASTNAKVVISAGEIANTGSASAVTLDATSGPIDATISGSTILKANASTVKINGAASEANKAVLAIKGTPAFYSTTATNSDVSAIETAAGATYATINVDGGSFTDLVDSSANPAKTTSFESAVKLVAGTLNVSAGTFKGATNAVAITSGKLNVTGAATFEGATAAVSFANAGSLSVTGAATFTGKNVISVEVASKAANINLASAGATYKATGTVDLDTPAAGFIILNHVAAKTATIGALAIDGGTFEGDLYFDSKPQYFISAGSFLNCLNLRNNEKSFLKEGKKLQFNKTNNKYYDVVDE